MCCTQKRQWPLHIHIVILRFLNNKLNCRYMSEFLCPSPCYLIHMECHMFLRVGKVDWLPWCIFRCSYISLIIMLGQTMNNYPQLGIFSYLLFVHQSDTWIEMSRLQVANCYNIVNLTTRYLPLKGSPWPLVAFWDSGVAKGGEGGVTALNRHKNHSLKKSKSVGKLGGGVHVTFSKLKLTNKISLKRFYIWLQEEWI